MADDEPQAELRRRDRMKATARRYVRVPLAVRTSDLPKRAASAVVMIAVAVGALLAGDPWLDGFILAVVLVTLVELVLLVVKATARPPFRLAGIVAGALYVGLAGYVLAQLPVILIIGIVGAVICVDTLAYFFGRTLGGPKIAPRISPSKTWAGLLGGVVGATTWIVIYSFWFAPTLNVSLVPQSGADMLRIVVLGALIAVAAQAGDFLESWLKRKAGVKDSSNLIPGHGGVFDRTDGMIPVSLLAGMVLGMPA